MVGEKKKMQYPEKYKNATEKILRNGKDNDVFYG